jgi:RimJ/RimL family protein N-acetyltransferase
MSVATIRIREIGPDEFRLVWPIFRAVVAGGDAFVQPPGTTFEQARRLWTAPPTRAFVAERDGVVVGSYMLRPNQPGLGDHVANAGYVVAEEARGQGIARALCEHSLIAAARAGFTAMQFNFVVATNESAVHLWTSMGFATVGRLPGAFRHAKLGRVDVLIMHRGLTTIRPVAEEDFRVLYEHQNDPAANEMAAFPPRDWNAFEAHWKRILADPSVVARAVLDNGRVAGNLGVFGPPGERLLGYWIGREHWGKGIATRGLALLLEEISERPLHAHVAKSNAGSIRVLEKNGFKVSGEDRAPAPTGGDVVDEWVMTLE